MVPLTPDTPLPQPLDDLVEGYVWRGEVDSQSPSSVYRLTADARPPLIVKIQKAGHVESLADEADRLDWLVQTSVAGPERVLFMAEGDREWLVMTVVKGANALAVQAPADTIVAAMAVGLRQVHALDPSSCPFDESLDLKLERARVNVEQGLVDETAFDDMHIGHTARDLLAIALADRPVMEDIVVTHGDACLPNVMMQDERFAGFVDCGRLGRADRYQDLAIACRNIASRLGASWVQPFLDRYGVTAPDHERLAYYRLVDEFF